MKPRKTKVRSLSDSLSKDLVTLPVAKFAALPVLELCDHPDIPMC